MIHVYIYKGIHDRDACADSKYMSFVRDSPPIYVDMFIFFSVQLQEILKEKWSIDDELVPPIDKHEDAQRGNDHQNNQTWTSKWMRNIPRPATSYSDSTTTEKNVSAESEYHDHRCPQVNAERHKRETKRQRILKTERGLHTLSCPMRSSCTRLIHYGSIHFNSINSV